MKPLLEDPDQPGEKAVFTSRSASQRSLRTERWRYTEWGGPDQIELYDHETDPGEFHNLANDPRHRKTRDRLRALMEKGLSPALPD